jgi:hypothetical protein
LKINPVVLNMHSTEPKLHSCPDKLQQLCLGSGTTFPDASKIQMVRLHILHESEMTDNDRFHKMLHQMLEIAAPLSVPTEAFALRHHHVIVVGGICTGL